jgi:hypothetical protein
MPQRGVRAGPLVALVAACGSQAEAPGAIRTEPGSEVLPKTPPALMMVDEQDSSWIRSRLRAEPQALAEVFPGFSIAKTSFGINAIDTGYESYCLYRHEKLALFVVNRAGQWHVLVLEPVLEDRHGIRVGAPFRALRSAYPDILCRCTDGSYEIAQGLCPASAPGEPLARFASAVECTSRRAPSFVYWFDGAAAACRQRPSPENVPERVLGAQRLIGLELSPAWASFVDAGPL